MKRILFSILFFAFAFSMNAQNVNLTVMVSNIKSTKGNIKVSIYNSDETFLKKPFKTITTQIKSGGKASVVFKGIPSGVYGAFAYHDLDNNGEMNANIIGIPQEPVVCSNKAKGVMGAPKFDDAKFELAKDSKIEMPFSNNQY